MKIVFLAKWKPDAEQSAIDHVLEVASESLAKGPFTAYEHGVGLSLAQGAVRVADWGFIVELDSGDLETWRASEAHEALGRAIRPICDEGMTIEF